VVLGNHCGTGVAGLLLQGGLGVLGRLNGLTIDSLLSIKLCLNNGEIVDCDNENNTDLFWACRGGYGNFGVALEFKLNLVEPGDNGTVVKYQLV